MKKQSIIGELNLIEANTFYLRLKGLLGVRELPEKHGILLTPCNNIHTFGMKIPLSIICLDKQGIVLKIVEYLPKNRIFLAPRGTSQIIELSSTTNLPKNLIGQVFFK